MDQVSGRYGWSWQWNDVSAFNRKRWIVGGAWTWSPLWMECCMSSSYERACHRACVTFTCLSLAVLEPSRYKKRSNCFGAVLGVVFKVTHNLVHFNNSSFSYVAVKLISICHKTELSLGKETADRFTRSTLSTFSLTVNYSREPTQHILTWFVWFGVRALFRW